MIYGYARVSTTEQHLDRQFNALLNEGVPEVAIYSDKQSGKNFERKNYLRLRKKIKKGDFLIVQSIDRLGRDYDMILTEWTYITKKVQADIKVLDMPLLNTKSQDGSLTGRLISDIFLQVLSYVAQKERESLKQRQAEGIAAAKQRGVNFGRPSLPEPPNAVEIYRKFFANELTAVSAANSLQISIATLYRRVKNNYSIAMPRKGPAHKATNPSYV